MAHVIFIQLNLYGVKWQRINSKFIAILIDCK